MRLLYFLDDHHMRPLALALHLILHRHRATDDCPRCLDAGR